MAKKKLFGNAIEPSCETCALGMVSSDGETVLCRHAGAPSKHHHCKRFRYDPLKRTPRRQPAPMTFTAADFSLDDPTEDLVAIPREEETVDPSREAMRNSLLAYLDDTDSPSADDILELLSATTPKADEEADALLNEAEEFLAQNIGDIPEDAPTDNEPLEALPEAESADEAEDVPTDTEEETDDDVVAIDSLPDIGTDDPRNTALASEDAIRRDMEQFSVELHEGASTRAAFDDFTVHFSLDEDEEDAALPEFNPAKDLDALFFDPGVDEDDKELLSDDLLFLNLDDLSGETIESLKLDKDGTVFATTEDL